MKKNITLSRLSIDCKNVRIVLSKIYESFYFQYANICLMIHTMLIFQKHLVLNIHGNYNVYVMEISQKIYLKCLSQNTTEHCFSMLVDNWFRKYIFLQYPVLSKDDNRLHTILVICISSFSHHLIFP